MEGAYKHFVDSAGKHFLEGFVDGVILFGQRGGVGKRPAFVGDDGGGGASSDDCGGARVDRWDENGGREGVFRKLGRPLNIGGQAFHIQDWTGPRRNVH